MNFLLPVPNNQRQTPSPCSSVAPVCLVGMTPVLPKSTHTLPPPPLSLDFKPPASMYQNSAWVLGRIILSTYASTILTYSPGVHWAPHSPSLPHITTLSCPTFQPEPLIHLPFENLSLSPPPPPFLIPYQIKQIFPSPFSSILYQDILIHLTYGLIGFSL